jgi:hypothetical protein
MYRELNIVTLFRWRNCIKAFVNYFRKRREDLCIIFEALPSQAKIDKKISIGEILF